MVDTARRDKMRSAVAKVRAEATALRDKLVDPSGKALVQPVLNTLSDVDVVFLANVDKDRTASQEALWLDITERYLQQATHELGFIAKQFDPYGGPEKVRTIG
jgi:hypothetical protein